MNSTTQNTKPKAQGNHKNQSVAIIQEQKIIEELIRHWLRRHHSILNIGCGTGIFLEKFWEAGLDITGIDSNQNSLEQTREYIGNKAELRLGVPEHLPFEDNSFDYSALMLTLTQTKELDLAIQEAIRVANSGILISFFNSWSLNYLYQYFNLNHNKKENCSHLNNIPLLNPLNVYNLIKKYCCYHRLSIRSTLVTPQAYWAKKGLCNKINKISLFVPFGSITVICVDFKPEFAVKPLWLKTDRVRVEYS